MKKCPPGVICLENITIIFIVISFIILFYVGYLFFQNQNLKKNKKEKIIINNQNSITCIALTKTIGQTGVEMEALTAVQVALLTIYDMCKAVDRGMVISNVKLLEKSGGKSGDWHSKD